MKKLNKKINNRRETLTAYSGNCNCPCNCAYQSDTAYRTHGRANIRSTTTNMYN